MASKMKWIALVGMLSALMMTRLADSFDGQYWLGQALFIINALTAYRCWQHERKTQLG
jgi:hypothetical protein